jgi:hypothetical protein
MRTGFVSLFIAAVLICCRAMAQGLDDCPRNIAKAAQEFKNGAGGNPLDSKLSIAGGFECIAALILRAQPTTKSFDVNLPQLVAAFQQSGSNAGSGGSTNLVAKGTTAKLLSVAAEYGGLTETTGNQTVTFSGSLGGIPVALAKNGPVPVCSALTKSTCTRISTVNALNRVSYGLVFNTAQSSPSTSGATSTSSSSQPTTFTSNEKTLNSTTVKIALINGLAPSSMQVSSALEKVAVTNDLVKVDLAKLGLVDDLRNNCLEARAKPAHPANGAIEAEDAVAANSLGKWEDDVFNELTHLPANQTAESVWENSAASLMDALKNDSPTCADAAMKDALAYVNLYASSQMAENAFYEALRATPMLSVEYDYNSPVNQPDYSTARLIGQINKKGWTGTLNAAGAFYNSTPTTVPGAGKVRDFQVSGEGAFNFNQLKSTPLLGDSTFSLAYYYQDQTSPAILTAAPANISGLPSTVTSAFAKRGVINIAQAKFAFIPRNSTINIPVSVTWSNRTELVTNPAWRGQVGITYNFDSLFSAPKN